MFATLLISILLQQVYSPAEFSQAPGTSLRARYDAAVQQANRAADDTYWLAYRFPVKPGVRVTTWDNNVSISSTTNSDGIEWIPDPADVQRIGIFVLARKTGETVQRTRLINLRQNFRVHDRKVYWLGEPGSDESLSLLDKLIADSPQKFSSSFTHYMSLHDGPNVTDHLLRLARSTSNSTEVRRSAISYLSREISKETESELEKLAVDPNADIQRQALSAIGRRPDDESIPAFIRIANDRPNAVVRKQAIQVLGQKKDPRVLDFFEQLLKKGK